MASTISEVANKLSEVLGRWSTFVDEIGEWATGRADGGPNGDGTYPITKPSGDQVTLTGFQRLVDDVVGPAAESKDARDAAQTARAEAKTAEDNAEIAQNVAQTARNKAQNAEQNAQLHRDDAQNAANNVTNTFQKRFPSDSKMRIPNPLTVTPSTTGDGGTLAWDDNYLYLKTTQGWKKIPLKAL